MIKAYDLNPSEGSLSGAGLRLDFQVQEGSYRVDFLADRWLVVEIDGAAYHSSREAIERDRVRDAYFESLGYSVLRIPAKVVFDTPQEAVRRVRSALRVGKRPVPIRVQKSGWQRLSGTITAINDGLFAINAAVAKKDAVDRALKDAQVAFHAEKCAIQCAVESAKQEVEVADWLKSQDGDTRESFESSYTRIMREVAERRGAQQDRVAIVVRSFPAAPPLHGNPEYDVAIQASYGRIAEARAAFIEEQRVSMMADARMPPIVEKKLGELGCGTYWGLLGTIDDAATNQRRDPTS